MVIKYKSYNDGEVVDLATSESYRDAGVYCTAAEVKKLPIEELKEGYTLYISDWKQLDESKQAELKSRTHILSADKQWRPL